MVWIYAINTPSTFVSTPTSAGASGRLLEAHTTGYTGSTLSGPRLNGRIVEYSGADWPAIREDGVVELNAHYMIEFAVKLALGPAVSVMLQFQLVR